MLTSHWGPVHPLTQTQLKEPLELTQVPPLWQIVPSVMRHSSMSRSQYAPVHPWVHSQLKGVWAFGAFDTHFDPCLQRLPCLEQASSDDLEWSLNDLKVLSKSEDLFLLELIAFTTEGSVDGISRSPFTEISSLKVLYDVRSPEGMSSKGFPVTGAWVLGLVKCVSNSWWSSSWLGVLVVVLIMWLDSLTTGSWKVAADKLAVVDRDVRELGENVSIINDCDLF